MSKWDLKKILLGLQFIGKKAYTGHKLQEKLRKSANFDQNL
jgi:hypothetical protein